ncbi:hypothetical protein F5B17DRAFT_165907 [Nemania serpens]|nr:hypothetical protein F5B17DRAFT_165907 [Nemania serpens]
MSHLARLVLAACITVAITCVLLTSLASSPSLGQTEGQHSGFVYTYLWQDQRQWEGRKGYALESARCGVLALYCKRGKRWQQTTAPASAMDRISRRKSAKGVGRHKPRRSHRGLAGL